MTDEELDDAEGGERTDVAEASCPWCGETVELTLDPGGGDSQDYVEDCPVCCRPWRVLVVYDEDGEAEVTLDAEGDW